jgi:hypothetical protein
LARAALPVTAIVEGDPLFRVDADLHIGVAHDPNNPKADRSKGGRRLFRKAGQVVRKSVLDAAYDPASVTAVAPATGALAGGTVVTLTGTALDGATGATVGGAAATAFSVLSRTQVRFTTPAGTAGAKPIVVTDDSGSPTLTSAFTYA